MECKTLSLFGLFDGEKIATPSSRLELDILVGISFNPLFESYDRKRKDEKPVIFCKKMDCEKGKTVEPRYIYICI